MPAVAAALWIANVALETFGQLALKAAAERESRWARLLRSRWLWAGIIAFTVQFAAWLALLSLLPLGKAMLINSITIVTVVIAGRAFFKERLTPLRVAGAALVSIGVALAGAA